MGNKQAAQKNLKKILLKTSETYEFLPDAFLKWNETFLNLKSKKYRNITKITFLKVRNLLDLFRVRETSSVSLEKRFPFTPDPSPFLPNPPSIIPPLCFSLPGHMPPSPAIYRALPASSPCPLPPACLKLLQWFFATTHLSYSDIKRGTSPWRIPDRGFISHVVLTCNR